MTKIFLIRHAEAEGNYYRRMQGWYDGAVTARGKRQIEALADRFRDIQIDALYSSDLRRTRETAGAILKYHELELNTDERLRETDVGSWENLPFGNISYDEPQQMAYFSRDPEKWSVPGSEGYRHLQARMTDAVTEIAARHDGETVAVVSHGMAIRSLICRVLEVTSERVGEILHGDNTCVALLEYEGGDFRLKYYNDNSHLPEEISTFAGQKWWKQAQDKPDLANLRLLPMDLSADGGLYKDCYADAWRGAHGNLAGFNGEIYLSSAKKVSAKDPRCVMKCLMGTDFVGLVELDPERMSKEGAGWISFLYLTPKARKRGFAPQLLGHAVTFFRGLGRSELRLHVAEANAQAIRFYERESFSKIGTESGAGGKLFLMEMSIL